MKQAEFSIAVVISLITVHSHSTEMSFIHSHRDCSKKGNSHLMGIFIVIRVILQDDSVIQRW